jgi:hypothetical protein
VTVNTIWINHNTIHLHNHKQLPSGCDSINYSHSIFFARDTNLIYIQYPTFRFRVYSHCDQSVILPQKPVVLFAAGKYTLLSMPFTFHICFNLGET